jgi:hypothetical protein
MLRAYGNGLIYLFLIYLKAQSEALDQWYSTFFVRVPPDIIFLQLCTPKAIGV